MLREKTYNKPVNPMGLYMLTNRHRVNQLGFLGISTIVSGGIDLVKGAMTSPNERDAHIAAQNTAGEQLAVVVDAYQQMKAQGILTYQEIQDAKSGVLAIANTFCDYAKQVGTARAQQGCNDILALAKRNAADMEADARSLGLTSSSIPRIDPTTGEVTYPAPRSPLPIPDTETLMPLILGGLILAAAFIGRGRG